MARSTRQPPAKDPTYDPKRVDDKPVFWAYSIADRITWPITMFFLLFLGGISLVWLKYGETRAIALLAFLQDNVIQALVGILAVATVAVLRKVPQLGRFEKRQAATQAEVEQARDLAAQVLAAVKSAPAGSGDRVDPTPSEVLAIVRGLQVAVGQIQANTRAAVEVSQSAARAVSHYGQSLETIAAGVSTITGPTPRQEPAARPSVAAVEPEWSGGRYGRPEARSEPQEGSQDWTRRDGSHRAQTTQQPAVGAGSGAGSGDEHEDWQGDDGPGLDTGYRTDFREQMAAAEARERAARDAAAQRGPAPIWPGTTQSAADDDMPAPIRAARDRAREQIAREQADAERRRRWTNPEEGN